MKRIIFTSLILCVLLAACNGPSAAPTSAPTEPPSATPVPVAAAPTAAPTAATSASHLPKNTTAPPPPSEQANSGDADPFTYEGDLLALRDSYDGYTLGDFLDLIKPDTFTRWFEGATGATHVTLENANGSLTLQCYDMEEGIYSETYDEIFPYKSGSFSSGEKKMEVSLSGVTWLASDFPIPNIRGIGIGAKEAAVIAAFGRDYPNGDLFYERLESNPVQTELAPWADMTLTGETYIPDSDGPAMTALSYQCVYGYGDVYAEEYYLEYFLEGGVVTAIVQSEFFGPE